MNRTHKSLTLAAAALGLASFASAQVMDQIPTSALAVVKFNHIKQTSDKVAKFAADLGVAAFVPQLADPLGALEQQVGVKQGIDDAGDIALAFLDPAEFGNDPDKAVVGLLPVTDYKAFIANFPDAKTDGAVTEVELPNVHYFANWGKYAAVSANKDILSKKPAVGLKLPTIATKETADKDAVVFANLVALRAKFLPELQQQRPKLIAMMEDGLNNEAALAKYTPIFRAVMNQGLNVAEGFLNDADAATFGLTLAPEGINSTLTAEFKADSYAAKKIGAVKNTDAPLLAGLPDGKYLFFGGGVSDPEVSKQVLSDLADPIEKEVSASGPDLKVVGDYIELLKTYAGAQKGSTFGMLAPSGAIGVEPLLQFFNIQTGDSKTLMDTFSKMADIQAEMSKTFAPNGVPAVKPTRTAAAKTLDGVTFDQIVTKVDNTAQDPMAQQQAQVMNMLYGPQGAVVNYAAVGDKVLLASGMPDAVITQAIDAIKAGDAPLANMDKVKTVAGQLPKQRLAVVYIALDDIVSTGMNYARQFGAGLNVQLPPDLPPIGATLATEGTSIKVDSHVPTTLIQSLVAAGMQAQMQMGGGPHGGGL